jgi:hypothetical protein
MIIIAYKDPAETQDLGQDRWSSNQKSKPGSSAYETGSETLNCHVRIPIRFIVLPTVIEIKRGVVHLILFLHFADERKMPFSENICYETRLDNRPTGTPTMSAAVHVL